jgi:hypothetical protein
MAKQKMEPTISKFGRYCFYSSFALGTAAYKLSHVESRRTKLLDFYVDNIIGKPEHEKPSLYAWAEDLGLIGDVPTAREIPRLEKRLDLAVGRRVQKRVRKNTKVEVKYSFSCFNSVV